MTETDTRALIMEFLGTFSLIFIGGWSVYGASGKTGTLYAAFGHGALLAIYVFIGAKISGAHYNPAVTLGLLSVQQIELISAVFYIIAQLLGSLVAGFTLSWLRPGMFKDQNLGYPHLAPKLTLTQAFFMEFLGTFFLVFSIYACACHRADSPSTCAGVIGITLFFGICAFGDLTGGAFNPARTFGPSIVNKEFQMRGWWVYYTATTLGGVFGALIYRYVVQEMDEGEEKAIKAD